MHKLLRKPSPAMIVACLALFLAGTGTGVAVVSALPANSVGSAQLKSNAVVSSKVKNRSLKAVDFAAGQLPKGAKGDTGATGATGPSGPSGPAGLSEVERVDAVVASSSVTPKTASPTCPTGKRVIGGGALISGPAANRITINAAFPDSDGTKFNVSSMEITATALNWSLNAYALCAKVS
ncbi:MAG: hypothetical protein ACXVZP_05700 [Gaiellaceae bacterium]